MAAELGSPYLPLRLVEEHLNSIEVLWLRRDHEACMMLPSSVSAEAWSTKLEAHIAALVWRKEEAIREASLRLTSPLYSEVFTAAYCLMRLSPERCVARDGQVLFPFA